MPPPARHLHPDLHHIPKKLVFSTFPAWTSPATCVCVFWGMTWLSAWPCHYYHCRLCTFPSSSQGFSSQLLSTSVVILWALLCILTKPRNSNGCFPLNSGNFLLAWIQSEYEWYCCKLWVIVNFPACARLIPAQTEDFAFLLAEFHGISACPVLRFLKVHLGWDSGIRHVSHSPKSALSWNLLGKHSAIV